MSVIGLIGQRYCNAARGCRQRLFAARSLAFLSDGQAFRKVPLPSLIRPVVQTVERSFSQRKVAPDLSQPMDPVTSREQFVNYFPQIMEVLGRRAVLADLPDMRRWIERVVEYNVQGGKMNRGIALVESYKIMRPAASSDDVNVAIILGWAIELLQAFFLVADDILDGSHTRRNRPCWYQTNNLGVKAFNDSILLESCVYQLISSCCRHRPYYTAVLDLFHDVTMLTAMGQTMDLQSSPGDGERPDLDLFTMEKYSSIIKHKTAYYSFYLPVALALNMAGIADEQLLKRTEEILLPMGHFFQVQDDYLDCFGDPQVTGKKGTDIEDGKCTWLIVTALSVCSPAQRQLIQDHYGLKDEASVAAVKAVFRELEMDRRFVEYEESSSAEIQRLIQDLPESLPVALFQGFMAKIYKRKS